MTLAVNNVVGKDEVPGSLTVGEGVRIVGKLVVPGKAVINGSLEGELQADDLLVGPRGVLTGQVKVRTADVHGTTHDTIEATEFLCVRSSGQVHGQARYGEVEIEKGGVFRGAIAPFAGSEPAFTPEVKLPVASVTPVNPASN